MSDSEGPPQKKPRLGKAETGGVDGNEVREKRSAFLSSLTRSVTPPLRSSSKLPTESVPAFEPVSSKVSVPVPDTRRCIQSPIQLTHIRDLPSNHNVDTVRITDLLRDPMIRECWQFNYLFDVDWLMAQFDSDVRDLIKVKVVHGSWKREAPNRIAIEVHLRGNFDYTKLIRRYRKLANDTRTSKQSPLIFQIPLGPITAR